jgi:putative transposase
MTNHVHLALEVGEISLSIIMQNLSFRYTRHINQRYDKVGHLFKGRFKAILIDEDNYLLDLIRYIHLNPVRAKMVNHAEEHSWSSHRADLALENPPWLTTEYILGYFENSKLKLRY